MHRLRQSPISLSSIAITHPTHWLFSQGWLSQYFSKKLMGFNTGFCWDKRMKKFVGQLLSRSALDMQILLTSTCSWESDLTDGCWWNFERWCALRPWHAFEEVLKKPQSSYRRWRAHGHLPLSGLREVRWQTLEWQWAPRVLPLQTSRLWGVRSNGELGNAKLSMTPGLALEMISAQLKSLEGASLVQ